MDDADALALGQAYTKANEGCRLVAYMDTRGVWTIGYGHAFVEPGSIWTQAQCNEAFDVDYTQARAGAQLFLTGLAWAEAGAARQAVLTDMAFQLGTKGLAEFKDMQQDLEVKDYSNAASAALASRAAEQTPKRWQRHADILRLGDNAIVSGALPT